MMGDRYVVLGFAPALRFLWSQIMCRLYKGPTDEIINLGPPRVQAQAKRSHRHVKDNVVRVSVRWIMETPNPACIKSVRVFTMLKLDTILKKKKSLVEVS